MTELPKAADNESTIMASASTSGSVAEPQFLHPDAGAAASASQRGRYLPADVQSTTFRSRLWSRHREKILIAELSLTALFFLLALYFLVQWLLFEPPIAYAPDREGFRAALTALDPVAADERWDVTAESGRWRGIVVHHTAGTRGSVASIDRYHREHNKWPNGLGYHFLIGNGDGMEDGEVAAGPRWEKQQDGAHVRMRGTTKGNSFSIGVALVGNFEEKIPSPKQLAALRGLLEFLTENYDIPASAITGHGQVSEKHTACPGRLFFIDDVVASL